jgi:hypothetical protein
MRSQSDLTGLIKFLGHDGWKSSFEEVLGEYFGPATQEFDPRIRGNRRRTRRRPTEARPADLA